MRKSKIPNQLQNLNDDQLALLHSWFPKFGYRQIAAKLRDLYQIEICDSQLCRYYQRLQDAQELSKGAEKPLTVPALLAIHNGDLLPADAPAKEFLKQRCLQAAQRPNLNGRDLMNFFRVFTYDERRAYAEHRLAIEKNKNERREQKPS